MRYARHGTRGIRPNAGTALSQFAPVAADEIYAFARPPGAAAARNVKLIGATDKTVAFAIPSKGRPMALDPQALYVQLGRIIETMPMLRAPSRTPAMKQWLGRASALVEASGNGVDTGLFTIAAVNVLSHTVMVNARAADEIETILYRSLARAELNAPTSAQGAFIPTGGGFDALAALAKIMGAAKSSLLLVDPYMDEKLLTDFAAVAGEGVFLQLLADQQSVKPALKPAAARWMAQHGQLRPIEARLAAARSLHDRLIVVDQSEAWVLTQSFNAIAARSPASIVRSDTETAALKIAYYENVWAASPAL